MAAVNDLARWLRSRDGETVLDDAVLGCLSTDDVVEIAEDFGVSLAAFRRELTRALDEGN